MSGKEKSVIDEKTKEKLKRILISIAVADASEAIAIAQSGANGNGIKMSKNLSRAISSMRVKSDKGSVDIDLKLLDKLKAIELYFKLCDETGGSEGGDNSLFVEYGYTSPSLRDED